jgi:hypothetical protein
MAEAQLMAGRFAQAEELTREALARADETGGTGTPWEIGFHGVALARLGRLDEAQTEALRVVALARADPAVGLDEAPARLALGIVALARDRYPDAVAHLRYLDGKLTGASYGSGMEETDSAVSRRCIYGAQTRNVFEVIVVQAASVAQATAQRDKLRADAQRQFGGQVDMNQLSGIGDDAEWLHAGPQAGISVAGIYVLKGTVGFGLVDVVLGAPAPSQGALTDQAKTVLGRLP